MKLPGILTSPSFCWSRTTAMPMTRPTAIPSREIIQPSSTKTRRMNLSSAPMLRRVPMSSFFSMISMERLPKMLKAMMMSTKIRIR